MRRNAAVGVLLVVVLAGAGCGKAESPKASATTTTTARGATTTTTARGATTTTTARGATTTTTARGATTTTTARGATATTSTTVPVTAKLDHACVHPGERQGLTVTGPPNAGVGYDTIYSDGSGEFTNHYGTGFGKGNSSDTGVYYDSWVLALNVPTGPATVNVIMTNGRVITRTSTTFTIKGVGQSC